jgi:hypothetical protein
MRIVVLLCVTLPLLAAADSDKKLSLKEKIACFLYDHTMPIAGISSGVGICGASGVDWLITDRSIWRSLPKRLFNPSPSPSAPAPASPPAGEILCASISTLQRPPVLSIDPAATTRGNDPQLSSLIADQVAQTKRLHRENCSSFQVGLFIGGSIIAASLLYLLYEHFGRNPEEELPQSC